MGGRENGWRGGRFNTGAFSHSGQIIAVHFSVQLIVFQNVEYQSAPRFASGDTEARENKGKKHAVIDFMLHLYFKGMRMSVQLHCASLHGLVSCVSFQPHMTHAIGTLYNVVVFIRVNGWGLLQRTMVNLFAFSPSPTEAFY